MKSKNINEFRILDEKKFIIEDLVWIAETCERGDRYNDMAIVCEKFGKFGKSLTEKQKNLLSVAFKNIIGSKRSSWRVIKSLTKKHKNNPKKYELLEKFCNTIALEIIVISQRCIKLFEEILFELCENDEDKLFFFKSIGDYCRYICEVSDNNSKEFIKYNTRIISIYKEAEKIIFNFPPTNRVRLSYSLNKSVYNFDIVKNKEKAIEIAKIAFENAMDMLDKICEDEYKDATLIMQLLKDNITLWMAENENEEGEVEIQDSFDN